MHNTRILLDRRPVGEPVPEDFRIVEEPLAPLADGELRIRGQWLSLDPYMRGRMNEGKSYVKPVELGAVMCGEVVGEVAESRHPEFAVGGLVAGDLGWQSMPTSNGTGLRKLLPGIPPAAQLSVCGMPGVTAWCGLMLIGAPKAGETVVVSAAAGAVGSVVGQIAKLKGCRVVGIAGGADKCRHVIEDLGFDACIDYKAGRLREDLKAATPNGVDIYFDNVGGETLTWLTLTVDNWGNIASIGLAGGAELKTTVMPFILRGVNILGINSSATLRDLRLVVWNRIATDLKPRHLDAIATRTIGFDELPGAFAAYLQGTVTGRTVVKIG